MRLLEAVSAQWGAVDRARLRDEANEAEVLRRADEVKSALLDAVSHDLRTPLASILASAGSLRQRDVEWDDEARASFAEAIEQEAHRLDRIVGNLLDLSRLESGTLQPDRGWYEPTALINEVAARLRPLVAPHPLALDLPDELPLCTSTTRRSTRCSNLIENAAKYSPPDSEIRAARRSATVLRVDVTDQGPGVARDAMPRLFEPFFRAARAQRGGSGLGLAVARGLVEAHGGRIWAENRPEGGARFSFEIPDGTEPGERGPDRGARILVVDDEPALRRAVERNLAGHGFEVRGARPARRAGARDPLPPDLVLLDMVLPDIPGTEVIQRLGSAAACRSSSCRCARPRATRSVP